MARCTRRGPNDSEGARRPQLRRAASTHDSRGRFGIMRLSSQSAGVISLSPSLRPGARPASDRAEAQGSAGSEPIDSRRDTLAGTDTRHAGDPMTRADSPG